MPALVLAARLLDYSPQQQHAGSICLTKRPISQPFIDPLRLTSATSAEYLTHATLDHRHGFSAGSDHRQVEAALLQGVTNDLLQWFFVLDHENYRHAFQFPLRAASNHVGSARQRNGSRNVQK